MAKITKQLTDTEIKKAKPKEINYKLFDGDGLFLIVLKSGTKSFRFNFLINNTKQTITIGKYPEVSLQDAREQKNFIKQKLRAGIDPRRDNNKEITLNDVCSEWLSVMTKSWVKKTFDKIEITFKKNIFPYSGQLPISNIKRSNIIDDIDRIQKRNSNETASRLIANLNRVFKYAVAKEYCDHNIIADIDKRVLIVAHKENHYNAITDKNELKKLISEINTYRFIFANDLGTAIALEIIPFIFLRPYNIRALEKKEINFDEMYIHISAEKMKNKEDFIMPINRYVADKLQEAIKIDYRNSDFVFPSIRDAKSPISDATLNAALKRLGYHGLHTVHGFRSSFSTNMYDLRAVHKMPDDVIEACLSHTEKNKIKSAYNRRDRFKYLSQKRELLEFYFQWIENI